MILFSHSFADFCFARQSKKNSCLASRHIGSSSLHPSADVLFSQPVFKLVNTTAGVFAQGGAAITRPLPTARGYPPPSASSSSSGQSRSKWVPPSASTRRVDDEALAQNPRNDAVFRKVRIFGKLFCVFLFSYPSLSCRSVGSLINSRLRSLKS